MNITRAQFIDALRKNAGIASKTAKYIETHYKISYTRQTVHNRKKKLPPEILAEIDEIWIDDGESALQESLQSSDDAVKLRAAQYLLDKKGKSRGYGNAIEINPPSEPIEVVVITKPQK